MVAPTEFLTHETAGHTSADGPAASSAGACPSEPSAGAGTERRRTPDPQRIPAVCRALRARRHRPRAYQPAKPGRACGRAYSSTKGSGSMPDDEHFQCDGDTKCPKAPTHAHPG